MINLWIQLFPFSDIRKCCSNLAHLGKIDYIFDMVDHLISIGQQKTDYFASLIVESFKEALCKNEFQMAIQIRQNYDFILETNPFEISGSLIHAINSEPSFMEVKLRMVEKFLSLFDFDTI